MKKNKFILTVLVFALALCMLVACGEKPQAPNGNQQGDGNGGGGESPKPTTYTAIFTDENFPTQAELYLIHQEMRTILNLLLLAVAFSFTKKAELLPLLQTI